MLTEENGKKAVIFARNVIEKQVKNKAITMPEEIKKTFQEKQGAFVTIHIYSNHELRGCIGIPLPVMPLKDSITEAAKSVTHDPRFPPLSENELEKIIVEVTILTKPELINVKKPQEYLDKIKIGRDGLIVEQGFYKGLLLPQVPIEQGWDKNTYLSHTCMKAGLPPDAWFEKNTKISKFTGQIFTEIKPRGEIKEKKINGS